MKRNAWLYRVRSWAYRCVWHWPPHHVIAAIERWRLARDRCTRPRRRLLYDVLIASAKDALRAMAWRPSGPQWLVDWVLDNFYYDLPLWAIPGLGCALSDDLDARNNPRWQRTSYRDAAGRLVEQLDQVHVHTEGWHAWSVAPGRNALYLGVTPEPHT